MMSDERIKPAAGAPPPPHELSPVFYASEPDLDLDPFSGFNASAVSTLSPVSLREHISFRSWISRLSSRKFQITVTSDVALAVGVIAHLFPGQTGVIVGAAVTGLWIFVEGMADVIERYQVHSPPTSTDIHAY